MRRSASLAVALLILLLGSACTMERDALRRTVNTRERIGPYSEAVLIEELAFLSGQLGISRESGQLADGVEEQTRLALENLQTVAAAAGVQLADAVRVEIYLTDIAEYAKVNAVYARFFPAEPPARTCVEVRDLPLHARVEIAATIARREED